MLEPARHHPSRTCSNNALQKLRIAACASPPPCLPPLPPLPQEVSVDGQDVVYKDVIEPLESVSVSLVSREGQQGRTSGAAAAPRLCEGLQMGVSLMPACCACRLPAADTDPPASCQPITAPQALAAAGLVLFRRTLGPPCPRRACPRAGAHREGGCVRVWRPQGGGLHASRQGADGAQPGDCAAGGIRGGATAGGGVGGGGGGRGRRGVSMLPGVSCVCVV